MAFKYTKEKRNSLDKETIIQLFLSQQDQLENIDHMLQLVLEQVADLKRHRFGRSSERHKIENQISFMEVDGKFFNESEAVAPKKAPKMRRPCHAGSRRKNRESGKQIWKVCQSLWSSMP